MISTGLLLTKIFRHRPRLILIPPVAVQSLKAHAQSGRGHVGTFTIFEIPQVFEAGCVTEFQDSVPMNNMVKTVSRWMSNFMAAGGAPIEL